MARSLSTVTYQARQMSTANKFSSSIFVDPEDNTYDIGTDKPSYRGSLVIVPTPIGNLGDLSLRQFEALTTCDIIACEDTRKTGKMLKLLLDKKVKDKFKNQFGASFESFYDDGFQSEEQRIQKEMEQAAKMAGVDPEHAFDANEETKQAEPEVNG